MATLTVGFTIGVYSEGNVLRGNRTSDALDGLRITTASFNRLESNLVERARRNGIFLFSDSQANTIRRNIVQDCATGLAIRTLAGGGIFPQDNVIVDNFFSNPVNAVDEGGWNVWDMEPVPGPNIVDGAWIAGNLWSDYPGVDLDGDGIGDTNVPYTADGRIVQGGISVPWCPRTRT